ncbi:4-hydroxythreonine-4-phosphate dehydrogenase [hydrothermal vent metagenome]|uniref:4-hydroxythreonine-4-phosphate dehydrogenase n=1 Tax=hydrothermal vent metagenome TaxID=652676 RepID=A0A3B1CZI9_9ZZZZ
MEKKKIAITMGDAGGIGPEVAVKAALSEDIQKICHPCLIGDKEVLEEAARISGVCLNPEKTEVIQPRPIESFLRGSPSPESGKASYIYIKYAAEGCLMGDFHAMVTAPVSKEALKMAGLPWPGHTEMLAELTSTEKYAMMLIGGPLRVVLVTTHIPLKEVPGKLTEEIILRKIELACEACRMLGIKSPAVAVSGLNPHGGEGGLFGREEIEVIGPAIKEAQGRGLNVKGPFPPDVVFRLAYTGKVDIVIAMYHDQGLIPLKMIAFDQGVNITIGLPIIRTSPDHGTAYDIAWGGTARPDSMIEAVKLAVKLSPQG